MSAQNTLKYLLMDLGITDDDIHKLVFKTTENNNKIGTISGISKFSDKEINALLLLTKEELKDKITLNNEEELNNALAKLNNELAELKKKKTKLNTLNSELKTNNDKIKKIEEQMFFLNIELKVLKTNSSAEGIRSILKSKYDLMAKVVFTVYARMLDPELAKNLNPKIPEIDGLLYKYYKQALCIGYATNKDNLYLFSHGGITTDFITTEIQGYELLEKMGDELVHICKTDSQVGGGNGKKKLTIPTKLHNQINLFNRKIFVYIGQIFYNTYDGNIQVYLNVLIAMSVPSDNNPIIRDSKYKTAYSPNQIGADPNSNLDRISELEKTTFGLKNKFNFKKIYNFFGHIPKGFGYSFGKATGSKNTYYVSTDFSNTMLKSHLLKPSTYDVNYLVLQLNIANDEMMLDGSIYLSIKRATEYKLPLEITETLKDNLLYVPDIPDIPKAEGDKSNNELNIVFSLKPVDFDNSNSVANGTSIFYNGIGTHFKAHKVNTNNILKEKGKTYKIFTKIEKPPNFNKALILVSLDQNEQDKQDFSGGKRKSKTILKHTHILITKQKKTRKHKRTRKHIRKQKNTRKH